MSNWKWVSLLTVVGETSWCKYAGLVMSGMCITGCGEGKHPSLGQAKSLKVSRVMFSEGFVYTGKFFLTRGQCDTILVY